MNLIKTLKKQQKDIEERNGLDHCKNCGLSGSKLIKEIEKIINLVELDGFPATHAQIDKMVGESCPSPSNPCMCSCHSDGNDFMCYECRMGRHKAKYPYENEVDKVIESLEETE